MQIVLVSIYVSIREGVGLITECTLAHKDTVKGTALVMDGGCESKHEACCKRL